MTKANEEFDEQLAQEASLVGTRETSDRLREEWTSAVAVAASSGGSDTAAVDNAAFNFGWAVSKSNDPLLRKEGIVVLKDLVARRTPNARDALFALALAYYSAGDWAAARTHCETCLRVTPDHQRALTLHRILRQRADAEQRQDRWAIGLFAVAAVGIVAGALARKR